MKHLLSGNEAAARGAYEAGVKVCSAYPGTPSTEIFENLPQYKDSLYCEWAPNEKVATEVAIGAALGGVRSLTAMKHVGVNVAADPIFTAAYNGVDRGFVIVSADDPSMHSSQNEQDNRHYARAARLPMVEPSDSQECVDFMKAAFEISEQWHIPVLYRVTTRVCHSKSLVEFSDRKEVPYEPFTRNIANRVSTPANAYRNHATVEKKMAELAEFGRTCSLNKMELKGSKIGVVTAGITYQYAKEVFPEDASFLKLGLTNPLPMELIREFAAKVEKLYVMEELDPFMEEQIKAAGIECVGKELTGLLYELNPQLLAQRVFGKEPETKAVAVEAVPRPPVLCPGCPHRGFFYTMSKNKNFVVGGDIGCYTLGALPPLSAMDTTVDMGASVSMAHGFELALADTEHRPIVAVIGDSTFAHSGLSSLISTVYNRGAGTVCVLDNRTTAMTGRQGNPFNGVTLQNRPSRELNIEAVVAALGVEDVRVVDPNDAAAVRRALKEATGSDDISVIVFRSPCVLLERHVEPPLFVSDSCTACGACVTLGCPALGRDETGRALIDSALCIGCGHCTQYCRFDAIVKE